MARLADAHVEQCKVLRAEGKSIREIQDIIEKTYSIKTYSGAIRKACGDIPAPKIAKRAYKKRKIADPAQSGDVLKEISALLLEINTGYKMVFAHLRTELIKSRQEVYAMLTGAGIDVPESEIK